MKRKRLTEVMPFLKPVRIFERKFFYYLKMYFDHNKYATKRGTILPYKICENKTIMLNPNTGYDIIYQKNKIHNLKIISKTMNNIIIHPGETFSFCYLAKNSHKFGKYKKGLVLSNNKIIPEKGGGICELSNLLYYSFLMTPLTIVERHGHKLNSFSTNQLKGVDAAINTGWLDLKVRNDTNQNYQIIIDIKNIYLSVKILSDTLSTTKTIIKNSDLKYITKNNKIYEKVSVIKIIKDKITNKELSRKKLYDETISLSEKYVKY